ncbi:hypothetical protein C8Q76DRAFT_67754 [Earliella scabrosa]|nr:hypothetical protein C8Q76DRAFT_67754 [Earliella scabrosa]
MASASHTLQARADILCLSRYLPRADRGAPAVLGRCTKRTDEGLMFRIRTLLLLLLSMMSRNLNSASPQTKETASPSETPEQRGSSHTNVIVFQLRLFAFNGRTLAISVAVAGDPGQRHISSIRSSRDERRLHGTIQQSPTGQRRVGRWTCTLTLCQILCAAPVWLRLYRGIILQLRLRPRVLYSLLHGRSGCPSRCRRRLPAERVLAVLIASSAQTSLGLFSDSDGIV